MALTILIKAEDRDSDPDLSLTLDTPRVVIGRSKSCEVQLPDPSVSSRHASIRRDRGRTLVMDEGSTNGTLVDGVKLPPHTPRPVSDGEIIRVGRVWLELRLGSVAVSLPGSASPAQRAQAVALSLLTRQLDADGEPTLPHVEVIAGPDAGTKLQLDDGTREYVVGRARDADLVLTDELVSRRHVTVTGDGVDWRLRDQRSKRGSMLGGEPLAEAPVRWSEDQPLTVGNSTLALVTPIVEAFEEALAVPDATMRSEEFGERPPGADQRDEPSQPEEPEAGDQAEIDDPEPPSDPPETEIDEPEAVEPTGLGSGTVDMFVVLIALGLLALSIAALMWVLG
jgi:pSer/pThr/pTyr-binding forkhead associated (FHA) protein